MNIKELISELKQWNERDGAIFRVFEFQGFKQAMNFVNQVAALAEKRDHHPDILIEYRKVTLTLTTHDAGGLTSKDVQLAKEIDAIH